jgi:hypothetical protein
MSEARRSSSVMKFNSILPIIIIMANAKGVTKGKTINRNQRTFMINNNGRLKTKCENCMNP